MYDVVSKFFRYNKCRTGIFSANAGVLGNNEGNLKEFELKLGPHNSTAVLMPGTGFYLGNICENERAL